MVSEHQPCNPPTVSQILMVRRAKEPDKGRWCFPGGSLELGEGAVWVRRIYGRGVPLIYGMFGVTASPPPYSSVAVR